MAWEVGLIIDGVHFQQESIALEGVLYQDSSIWEWMTRRFG
jgi:hypothetical protein